MGRCLHHVPVRIDLFADTGDGRKQERHVEDLVILDIVRQQRIRGHRHVDAAQHHALDQLGFVAKLAAGIDFKRSSAVGLGLQQLLHLFKALVLHLAGGIRVTDLEGIFLGRGRSGHGSQDRKRGEKSLSHGFSLLFER